jgi:hypothetical protein
MEVDVVVAAMQSTANVIRLLLSTLMMISEPFFESKRLRKHDLDHHTQFHPQYLIHVGSYVNPTSMPPKSEPKSHQATTHQATPQQATTQKKPTKSRRLNKMNPSIEKEQGIIKPTKHRWPQHMEKNPEQNQNQASRRSVVQPEQNQNQNQASRRGVVHPEQNQNQASRQSVVHPEQNQASRRGVVHPEQNQNQASRRGVVHPEQNQNQASRRGVVHPEQNQASQRGVVTLTDQEHRNQNKKKQGKSVKDAEKLAATDTRQLPQLSPT